MDSCRSGPAAASCTWGARRWPTTNAAVENNREIQWRRWCRRCSIVGTTCRWPRGWQRRFAVCVASLNGVAGDGHGTRSRVGPRLVVLVSNVWSDVEHEYWGRCRLTSLPPLCAEGSPVATEVDDSWHARETHEQDEVDDRQQGERARVMTSDNGGNKLSVFNWNLGWLFQSTLSYDLYK